jgi:hypothetical protein
MAFTTAWVIPKRVVCLEVWGELDAETVTGVEAQMVAYMDEGQAPLYVIFTQVDFVTMRLRLEALPRLAPNMDSPQWGHFVVACPLRPLNQMLMQRLLELIQVGERLSICADMQAALALLGQLDPSLQKAHGEA